MYRWDADVDHVTIIRDHPANCGEEMNDNDDGMYRDENYDNGEDNDCDVDGDDDDSARDKDDEDSCGDND